MRVLRSDPLRWGPLRPHGSAITIGVFDGVHRGHRKVIEELTARAQPNRLDTVALTFDRHPLEVVAPEARLLTSVEAVCGSSSNSGWISPVCFRSTR